MEEKSTRPGGALQKRKERGGKCKANRWRGAGAAWYNGAKIQEEDTTMALLEVQHLQKVYTTRFGGNQVEALQNVNFTVEAGEYVAIMGESGSGKTTLLNILAALDRPTSGEVYLNGKALSDVRERDLAAFRRSHLGFVFQDFNLLDTFSLQDNIFLPLVLAGERYETMKKKLEPLARQLGISEILAKYPYEVSGGQKQRAAVARALITDPQLVLADEPTGALDSRASDRLLELFEEINAAGQTIVMVTHSVKAASHAGRVLFLRDGKVYHQLYRGEEKPEEQFRRISDTLTVLTQGGEDHA
jgi:putative ABC transport system ATP-binding protein